MRFSSQYISNKAVLLLGEDSFLRTGEFYLFREREGEFVIPAGLYISILLRFEQFQETSDFMSILTLFNSETGAKVFSLKCNITTDGFIQFLMSVYDNSGMHDDLLIPVNPLMAAVPCTVPILAEFFYDLISNSFVGYINRSLYRKVTTTIPLIAGISGGLILNGINNNQIAVSQLIVHNKTPNFWTPGINHDVSFEKGIRNGYPWWYKLMEPNNYTHAYEFEVYASKIVPDLGYAPYPFLFINKVEFIEGDCGMTLPPESYIEMKMNTVPTGLKFLKPYYKWKKITK